MPSIALNSKGQSTRLGKLLDFVTFVCLARSCYTEGNGIKSYCYILCDLFTVRICNGERSFAVGNKARKIVVK